MRFDLPGGHDLGPKVEPIMSGTTRAEALDNLCLTHRRCIAEGADHTVEVTERIRRRNEAALLPRPASAGWRARPGKSGKDEPSA